MTPRERDEPQASRKARKAQRMKAILDRRLDRLLARQVAGPVSPSHERLLRKLTEKRGAL